MHVLVAVIRPDQPMLTTPEIIGLTVALLMIIGIRNLQSLAVRIDSWTRGEE